MASRFGQHLLRAKFMVGNFGLFICTLFQLFVFCCFCFFYLLFDCLITNFWLLSSKQSHAPNVYHRIWVISFQPRAGLWRGWVSTPNWVACELWSQYHNTPNSRKYSAQTKTQFFQNVEMPQIPKTGRTWHCGGL